MMSPQKEVITRTWNEFWGPLLMIEFHRGNPARWTVREQKADWIFKKLNLNSSVRVLDLGCGDGLLDICLARLGAGVTAVDRISSVIQKAADEPDGALVKFLSCDFRQVEFSDKSFDLVLILDVIGLLSREDEVQIIRRVAGWLKPGGYLLIDCPFKPGKSKTIIEKEFGGGKLRLESTFERQTRQLHIKPQFHKPGGKVIELCDPYAKPMKQQTGIVRYIYPKKELGDLLRANGFDIQECHHNYSKGQYTFTANLKSEKGPH